MQTNTANDPYVTLVLPLSQVNVILQGLGEVPLKYSRMVCQSVEDQTHAELERQRKFMDQKPLDQNSDAQPANLEPQAT